MSAFQDEVPARHEAERYWRRQVALTMLAGLLALVSLGVLGAAAAWTEVPATAWRVGTDGAVQVARPAAELYRFVFWPAIAALVLALVLLVFAVAHGLRVATLTFRRGS